MKPEILVLARIYAPTLAALEQDYTVHKLWTAADPDAFLREVGGNIRAAVTTSLAGFKGSHCGALPKRSSSRALVLATAPSISLRRGSEASS